MITKGMWKEGRQVPKAKAQHRHGQLPALEAQTIEEEFCMFCIVAIVIIILLRRVGGFQLDSIGNHQKQKQQEIRAEQNTLEGTHHQLDQQRKQTNSNIDFLEGDILNDIRHQKVSNSNFPRNAQWVRPIIYIPRCVLVYKYNKNKMFRLETQISELCSQCRQGLLIVSQKGTFCSICHRYTSALEFQHESLKVPENYKTNSKPIQLSSRERNSKLYMNEFAQKYGVRGQAQIDILVGEVSRYLEDASRCKSYREVCAAIFYYNYREEMGLRAKGFCQDNQVGLKKFAKALMRYVAVRNRGEGEAAKDGGKEEGDQEEEVYDRCERFLRSTAKELFDFSYSNEDRKQEYIKAVMKNVRKTQHLTEVHCHKQQAAILVFIALKALNHPVSLAKYEQICKGQGMVITRKTLRETQQAKKTKKEQPPIKKSELSELSLEESTSNLY